MLVAAAASGDRDAVRDLWQMHRGWVAAIVLAHKPREADLEDLVQTVAVQFVRTITELREPEAFKPWLRTIATNEARAAGRKTTRRNRLRREAMDTARAIAHGRTDDGAPPTSMDQQSTLLHIALDLPEGYREPLLLRCVRGMSYRQIAAVLDLPETTIETRIARGRRMLRERARAAQADPEEADNNTDDAASPARNDRRLGAKR
mgnify:CR=1 FL=1